MDANAHHVLVLHRNGGHAVAAHVPRGAGQHHAEQAARLARQLGHVHYRHVRREHNELADRLVNEALDSG